MAFRRAMDGHRAVVQGAILLGLVNAAKCDPVGAPVNLAFVMQTLAWDWCTKGNTFGLPAQCQL